jgi:hypothetical protein
MKSIFLALAISTLIARTLAIAQIVQHEGTDYFVFTANFASDDRANLSRVIHQEDIIKGRDYNLLVLKNLSDDQILIMDAYFKTHHLLPRQQVSVPYRSGWAKNIVAHTNPLVNLDQGMYTTIVNKAKLQIGESSRVRVALDSSACVVSESFIH